MTAKVITIVGTVKSYGPDWPKEEMEAISKFFEDRGYTNIASGSGDGLKDGGNRWWQVTYERKVE